MKIVRLIILSVIFYFLLTLNYPSPTSAACDPTNLYYRAQGLISTPVLPANSKFSTTEKACVTNTGQAAYISYKLPNFDDIKYDFYDKVNSSTSFTKYPTITPAGGTATQGSIPLTADSIYYIMGNLMLTGIASGNSTGVVFVNGNLTFTSNYIYPVSPATPAGTVFVVKGDVYIGSSITEIDAVIISQGTIYTAATGSITSPQPMGSCATSQYQTDILTIRGSLMALDSTKPIKFCRWLKSNLQAAEKVTAQMKYLVILRDVFSSSILKWAEVSDETAYVVPTPIPTPVPTPIPTPVPTPIPLVGMYCSTVPNNGSSDNGCPCYVGSGYCAYNFCSYSSTAGQYTCSGISCSGGVSSGTRENGCPCLYRQGMCAGNYCCPSGGSTTGYACVGTVPC